MARQNVAPGHCIYSRLLFTAAFSTTSPSVRLIYGECITQISASEAVVYSCMVQEFAKSVRVAARRCVFALMSPPVYSTLETIVQVAYINYAASVMMPRPVYNHSNLLLPAVSAKGVFGGYGVSPHGGMATNNGR